MVIINLYYMSLFILADVKKQKRWVEITYVAHTHPQYDDMDITIRDSIFNKGTDNIFTSDGGPVVLNYRFLREFTKGLDPSSTHWTVSAVNHYRLHEVMP